MSKIKELEKKLRELRCDFERFREWAISGRVGFNMPDKRCVERQRKHGCKP